MQPMGRSYLTSRPRRAFFPCDASSDRGDEDDRNRAGLRRQGHRAGHRPPHPRPRRGSDLGPRGRHAAATGFGPCRLCLRTFREGEEDRILFTHDTYAGVSEFAQPGPVFIHADECEPYDGHGFPAALSELELTFEAVALGPRVVELERTTGADAEPTVARLLGLPEVDYVNVRNTGAGCFVARVERR